MLSVSIGLVNQSGWSWHTNSWLDGKKIVAFATIATSTEYGSTKRNYHYNFDTLADEMLNLSYLRMWEKNYFPENIESNGVTLLPRMLIVRTWKPFRSRSSNNFGLVHFSRSINRNSSPFPCRKDTLLGYCGNKAIRGDLPSLAKTHMGLHTFTTTHVWHRDAPWWHILCGLSFRL